MDYLKRALELRDMIKKLASMRNDEELVRDLNQINFESLSTKGLMLYIFTMDAYFSDLDSFTLEEIQELNLIRQFEGPISAWRRIKYEWAD